MKCRTVRRANLQIKSGNQTLVWPEKRYGKLEIETEMPYSQGSKSAKSSLGQGRNVQQIIFEKEMPYSGGSSLGLGKEGKYGKSKLICEMPYGSVTASEQSTAN